MRVRLEPVNVCIDVEADSRLSRFTLAEGYLRYEALRKLNVPQFRALFLAHLAGAAYSQKELT